MNENLLKMKTLICAHARRTTSVCVKKRAANDRNINTLFKIPSLCKISYLDSKSIIQFISLTTI